MSINKGIFPYMLNKPKIFRELLTRLTGHDPGCLEHLLLCGKYEETWGTNLSLETNIHTDYSIFEDESLNLYTIGIFHDRMYPEGYLEFLNDITTGYLEAKYGYCPPHLSRTIVGLIPVPAAEHCEENEFLINVWEKQGDPAIAEMLAIIYEFEVEHKPVTELGKAAQEYLISIWGENYWE